MKKTSVPVLFSLCLLFSSSFAFPSFIASGATVPCGTTITKSTSLGHDVGSKTSPCPGDGIDIGASSITLNCNGHTIWGTGSTGNGVRFNAVKHAIVKNCITMGFGTGFYIGSGATADTFTKDKAYNSLYDGFEISANGNTLSNDLASGAVDYDGVHLYVANNNKISNVISEQNARSGFFLSSSTSKNVFVQDTAQNNAGDGWTLASFSGTGNSLTGNKALSNTGYGLDDATSGTGTSGTANTYSSNTCSGNGAGTSSPAGLC